MTLWRWQNPVRAVTLRGSSVVKPRYASYTTFSSRAAHAASPGAADSRPAEALEHPPRSTSTPAQDLQRFLRSNGITATLLRGAVAAGPEAVTGSYGVPPAAAAAAAPAPSAGGATAGNEEQPGSLNAVAPEQQLQQQQGMCRIKSLVFETGSGGPHVVVVVLMQDRVERRWLAQVLGVRAAGVRLAPLEQLPLICGFPAGSVPPLGHQPRLPVIVDSAITQFSHCIVGTAGSGEDKLCLPVPEVLRVAEAALAAVAVSSSGGNPMSSSGGGGSLSSSESGWESDSETQAMAGADGSVQRPAIGMAAPLPVPWEAGSQRVTLLGLIAQKRKIARLLLFANLVPLPSSGVVPHVAPGSGTYLRRLWQCPEGSGRAVEVQLILGKTLAERLGKEEAARLLRCLKVGDQVRLVGCPQPHATPHGTRREAVYDVVVEEIQVITKQQPTAGTADTAGAAGAVAAEAALQKASPAASSARGQARGGSYLQLPSAMQPGGVLVDSWEGLLQLELALFQGSSSSSSSPASASLGVASSGSTAEAGLTAGGSKAAGQPPHDTAGAAGAAAVPAMAPPQPAPASTGTAPDGTLSNALVDVGYRAVVGMDCEWQPYQRGQPHTPVALLQLAVRWEVWGDQLASGSQQQQQQQQQQQGGESECREEVFLIDLLALCQSAIGSESSSDSSTCASSTSSGGESRESGAGVPASAVAAQELQQAGGAPPEEVEGSSGRQQRELSAEEALLSSILQRVFEDPQLLVVGFKLSHDLQRLCESYPHLPCFGSEGSVPFRSHVDVMHMANAVLPPAAFARGRGAALSRRLRTGMGLSALADSVLGQRIDKAQQCSDWAARPLSEAQRAYAATDAYALVSLFQQLLQLRRQRQEQLGLPLISPTWMSTLAAGIADVAPYAPSSSGRERGTGEATTSPSSQAPTLGHPSSAQAAPRPASTEQRQPLRPGGSAGISGTLQLRCNVEHLERQYLGQALSEGGKGAAVRAGAADSTGKEPGRTPSFPRGSGLLEWSNAFMLFVNLEPLPAPGQQAQRPRYDNRFLWGRQLDSGSTLQPGLSSTLQPGSSSTSSTLQPGSSSTSSTLQPGSRQEELYTTWWPGRGQTAEHPVMRRMGVRSSSSSSPSDASGASEVQVGSSEQAGSDLPAGSVGQAGSGEQPGSSAQLEEGRVGSSSSEAEPLLDPPQQQLERQQLERQRHEQQLGAGQEGQREPEQPALLLFCRPPGGPYVFCGRLRQAAPSASGRQGWEERVGPGGSGSSGSGSSGGGSGIGGFIVWQLLDWPKLQGMPAFQRLLAVQEM